ncbi:ribosomal protein S12 methylthiotransferase RimO [Desulfosarcina widdelii]|uniref:Ribosomal protein uS12 methylthiotransferase RimO n=1 Tax=Desulfosarcina widdelii TaxID=947919 RepID=A0A5K7ZJA6_9BACT|nr:30S ribosomal protein S12 methylthiotransferase RimO [Desulfosarcina widdelii]BBO76157.1 ribosomal protein S12 methylthiotransferase RimO [Desulfosarcina widdelii]
MDSTRLYIESLGCARNQVDSETMAGQLRLAGWSMVQEPARADVIVVNTCSFVASAIDESIDTILELARHKKTGRCRRLVVAGCLPERFRDAIVDALPEVDQFLGTGAFTRIADAVAGKMPRGSCLLPDPDSIPMDPKTARQRVQAHTAYLKIAEGCRRRCTYCIIPQLRGRQKSRPAEQILEEARELIADGVRELNLVAQDTTAYGQDLHAGMGFDTLLKSLAELAGQTWIRFLYGHPESITDRVIEAVADHDNLCPYFDLPVQHSAANVLRKMNRHYDRRQMLDLFGRIRAAVPDAAIRTTLIVGFPGETEADFQTLMDFIEQVRFDHLGVFTYSDAEDLPSHRLPDHVPAEVARMRYDALMEKQMQISADNLTAMVGRTVPVLVENQSEPHLFEGRSMRQAPEVDGLTFVRIGPDGPDVMVGQPTRVRITDALEYDLIGDAL